MTRVQIGMLLGILLLAGFIGMLVLRNPQAPFLPEDEDHRRSGAARCVDCHGLDGDVPRSKNHPIGDDCFRCHGVR